MGVYRRVYQPFGQLETHQSFVDPNMLYRTDWPGIVGTAATLGVEAYQLATGAQPLAPGAGVMAPSEAPPLLQAPPPGTPGVATDSGTSPIVLIIGAAALYYFLLK